MEKVAGKRKAFRNFFDARRGKKNERNRRWQMRGRVLDRNREEGNSLALS